MTLIANWMATWETYEATIQESAAVGEQVLLIVPPRLDQRLTLDMSA